MIIDFRQGIVDYDTTTFPFLASGGGSIVSLVIGTRPITLTIAQATNNYTFTEPANVPNAWTGLNAIGSQWLYWDFNTTTLVRTFGFTPLRPVAQATAPLTPATGQMWYNTSTFRNYVFQFGGWTEVLRVLAAEYIANAAPPFQFISEGDQPPFPSGYPNFTGTQIGVNQVNVASGFPLYDFNGVVIHQSDGTFLTTESEMFAQGAAITGVRLESNVYTAFSSDVTTIPAYDVVAVQPDGTIRLGSYNDAGNAAIAMAVQNIPAGGSGAICIEGTLTNVLWNWTGFIGELLWISGSQPGSLVTIDPHLSSPITYPVKQPPVARVFSQDTIMFLQGIGTQGAQGPPGNNAVLVPATPIVQGVVYLSTDGGAFVPSSNLVIAEGDPRLTNARLATAGSTLAATNITVTPYTPSNTYGANVQLALQALASNTLNLTGGTMTGALILGSNPTFPFQAATKQYVDNSIATADADAVQIAGSTMTGALILSGNPIVPLQAVTKQYVDAIATGLTIKAPVVAATTPLGWTNASATYAGTPNYTLTASSFGVFTIDGVSPPLGARILIKDFTGAAATRNGIYDVTSVGSLISHFILTRDSDDFTLESGTFVFVDSGTVNASTGWVLTTPNPITLDTSQLIFYQISGVALTSSAITTALGYVPVGPFPVTGSAGINVSGSPVSGPAPSGITLTLSAELLGLNALATNGFVQRTGVGTYVALALTSAQVTGALGYIPLASRNVNTIAPLAGGGPLTSDLILTINTFTGSVPGAVPTSPGGTTDFLRADGTWAAPPGGGGGEETDVLFATASQTAFTLVNVTATSRFPAGTISYITVYVNGILQREDNSTGNAYASQGAFYVSSSSTITFFVGLAALDEVTVYQVA